MSEPDADSERQELILDGGPDTYAKVRALLNLIWEVTHSDKTEGEMLRDLCFLSGVACSVLMNYARVLEAEATSPSVEEES